MTGLARSLQVTLHQPQPKALAGQGMVLAAGVKAAKVNYELLIDEAPGLMAGRGTLRAKHSTLKRMWLQPQATLRLANGRRLDISITELKSDSALFEVISEV